MFGVTFVHWGRLCEDIDVVDHVVACSCGSVVGGAGRQSRFSDNIKFRKLPKYLMDRPKQVLRFQRYHKFVVRCSNACNYSRISFQIFLLNFAMSRTAQLNCELINTYVTTCQVSLSITSFIDRPWQDVYGASHVRRYPLHSHTTTSHLLIVTEAAATIRKLASPLK